MSGSHEQENQFKLEYKKLNKEQKEAVDTIDGPVMVVAGPGTGKTQILALRIANILLETDNKADSILCLTFTNSGVKSMKERLRKYIGAEAVNIKVSTFHSFGLEILEKYYTVLGLPEEPKLLDDRDTVILFDNILHNNTWKFIRPRSDGARYFRDLKILISTLKRENINSDDFAIEVEKEIESLKDDPESISSRGATKGELKKDIQNKIEGLERTLEATQFYALYEKAKSERNLFDYDDILASLNKIMLESEEARDFVKINYQYVLIDEHQDSSGVQNNFLNIVWGDVDMPNIFVVGDDRQLIYGFGGASLEYFENFKNAFGRAKSITLIENYRSTQNIIDSAHNLIESSMASGRLKSNKKEKEDLYLVEAYYPRDEILYTGLEIQKKIKAGVKPNDIAVLVPKNRQVRSTMEILNDMGVPVSRGDMVNFFDNETAISFIRVLKILSNPNDGVALGESFFDKLSGINPLKAHMFLKDVYMRDFSLLNIKEEKNNLFETDNQVNAWIGKLKLWLEASNESLYPFVQKVGTEFLLNTAKDHEELVLRIEVIRTVLHMLLMQIEKNPKLKLPEFLDFLDRMEAYGETIPLAIFSSEEGVKVYTFHGSKGLEFDYVYIAHMDENSFSGSRKGGFTLPQKVKSLLETRDEEVLKRQLYVAMTRARNSCTISYALKSYSGGEQELASIVRAIESNFVKQSADQTEKIILKSDKKVFVEKKNNEEHVTTLQDLKKLVKDMYDERKVSVSLLNNFFECTWKWYFRNLLQLPEPKAESMEYGNIVHGSIDMILKKENFKDQDLESIILSQVRKTGFGDEYKQKELYDQAYGLLSKWVKSRLKEISLNRENEQSVSVVDDRFPHLNIYGKIDLIEKLDKENVRVTDFKTGGVRKKSEIEKRDEEGRLSGYLRQLAMYSYLIQQNKKWKVDVRESRLEFVEAGKSADAFHNTVITPENINDIVKDIKDYDEALKSGAWVDRPCHYNSYGKNTECEYCKRAKIYK